MDFLQNVVEALESLVGNKLRSALTVLGIVIGVGAVIAMLAIGRGAQNTITGSISSVGTNLLFVSSGARNVRNAKPLTLDDASAIADPANSPSVVAVAPLLNARGQVTVNGQSTNTQVLGVETGYDTLRNLTMAEGQFLTPDEILGRAAVAVIGPTTADNLFGTHAGVTGQTIQISGHPFTVIGVLNAVGGSGFQNPDDQIIVPLTTAQSRLSTRRTVANGVDMIMVQAASADQVQNAQDQITSVLESRHQTPVGGTDDFTITSQQSLLSSATTITNVLTIFLGGIAGISLLVGGIGVMNIMLVSVTERTREIGLRKAIGARKLDIMVQFLTESLLLSLAGGLIGILVGWGLSILVGVIAKANNSNINPAVSLDAILLATLFSAAIGIFFGLYPAKRASDLEPVEALRYE
jgi:putative ABC transport system permease protein